MRFDVAIIGGGPGGCTAADEAASYGLSVVLFEAGMLGGTCLNRGCIPTKALLHEAALGISDPATLRGKRADTVSALRGGIEKLMKVRKVTVVRGFAQITGPGRVSCDGELYEARDIIVASGSIPSIPPIAGADLPGVYTSNDVLEGVGIMPRSLAIIGGGVIGMEFALLFAQTGAAVQVLEAMDRILPPFDREIAQRVALHAKKHGIAIEASVQVQRIEGAPGEMRVSYADKRGQPRTLVCEGVLIATGRHANTGGSSPMVRYPSWSAGRSSPTSSGGRALPIFG